MIIRNLLKSCVMIIVLISFTAFTNRTGTIKGKITEKATGQPLPFANLLLEQNGKQVTTVISDMDGNYMFSYVPSGKYDLEVSLIGYRPVKIRNLIVKDGIITFADLKLEPDIKCLEAVMISDTPHK